MKASWIPGYFSKSMLKNAIKERFFLRRFQQSDRNKRKEYPQLQIDFQNSLWTILFDYSDTQKDKNLFSNVLKRVEKMCSKLLFGLHLVKCVHIAIIFSIKRNCSS